MEKDKYTKRMLKWLGVKWEMRMERENEIAGKRKMKRSGDFTGRIYNSNTMEVEI